MKALTLTQPWATAMAVEVKRIETRSWATGYRGLLAIHAAKGFPKQAKELAGQAYFDGLLPYPVPIGALVAIVRLVDCIRTEKIAPTLTSQELDWGDYTPGRWAWVTEFVERIEPPIPARGALGLWDVREQALGDER